MAEHRLITDAEFTEMEECRNKQFDKIFSLLYTLLQRQGLPPISSHSVENSFKDIPDLEPMNINLLMQDEFIPFVRKDKAHSTCAENLSVEGVTLVEFPLSTESTKTHCVIDEEFVEQLATDDSSWRSMYQHQR